LAGLAANLKPSRHRQLYAPAAFATTSCHSTMHTLHLLEHPATQLC
jgi:hypothetical protein